MISFKKGLIICLTMFVVIGAKSNATDCPEGYDTERITLLIGDCYYEVDLCYKCSPTGMDEGWISVWGFVKQNPSCDQTLSTSEVLDEIYALVNNTDMIEDLCGDIPPCNEGTYQLIIARNICYTKMSIQHEGVWRIYYWLCDTDGSYCWETYDYCWDNGQIQVYYNGPVILNGPPDCPETEPDDPGQGEQTECFYLDSNCNYP